MTDRLTNDQVFTLARAGVLLKLAADVLSDFEAQLVAEVLARWLDHGRLAVVSANEWRVIDGAVEAMTQARNRRFGRAA